MADTVFLEFQWEHRRPEADGYVPDRRNAAGRAVASTDLHARGGNTLAWREQRRRNAEFDARN